MNGSPAHRPMHMPAWVRVVANTPLPTHTLQSVIQPKAQLRGDLAPIRVGHYCLFDEGCVLRPPSTLRDGCVTPRACAPVE